MSVCHSSALVKLLIHGACNRVAFSVSPGQSERQAAPTDDAICLECNEPCLFRSSMICCTFWRLAPMLRASHATGFGQGVWPQRHPGTVLFATQKVYTAQSSGAGGRAAGICRATGGSVRKYAMSARISSSSQFYAWSQIIPCQWSVRPSGVMPLRMARAICWSVHVPIPVRTSLLMLRLHNVPKGRQLIFCPPAPFGL